MSKEERRRNEFDQSRFDDESILLSGPYGDDVAFVKQFNDQILLGLSDGVSGNRHHGLDPYHFAHTLILSCLQDNDRVKNSSTMRGLIHRAIRSIERRSVYGSATLCLLAIERNSSSLRSLNIGDSGFMLIRDNHLLLRSNPQYHRGSSPFQLSSLPSTPFLSSNTTRLYHDKPSDGEYLEETLQLGDLLLVASDGLFDNLYEDLIVQIINSHLDDQVSVESLEKVCEELVQSACRARIKRDDILVLLSCVVAGPRQSMVERNGTSQSASCSSSDSSLACLLLEHDVDIHEVEEPPLDLFIFEDPT